MHLGKSRRTIIQRTSHTGGSTTTLVTRGIEGRARQVLHVVGYHFWIQLSPAATANNQIWEMFAALQVDERDHGRQPVDYFDTASSPRLGGTSRIHALFAKQESIETVESLALLNGYTVTTGWVACDLVLPGLHLFTSVSGTLAESYEAGVTFEYEWVTADLGDLAAVNLHWGRDPNDFDRG